MNYEILKILDSFQFKEESNLIEDMQNVFNCGVIVNNYNNNDSIFLMINCHINVPKQNQAYDVYLYLNRFAYPYQAPFFEILNPENKKFIPDSYVSTNGYVYQFNTIAPFSKHILQSSFARLFDLFSKQSPFIQEQNKFMNQEMPSPPISNQGPPPPLNPGAQSSFPPLPPNQEPSHPSSGPNSFPPLPPNQEPSHPSSGPNSFPPLPPNQESSHPSSGPNSFLPPPPLYSGAQSSFPPLPPPNQEPSRPSPNQRWQFLPPPPPSGPSSLPPLPPPSQDPSLNSGARSSFPPPPSDQEMSPRPSSNQGPPPPLNPELPSTLPSKQEPPHPSPNQGWQLPPPPPNQEPPHPSPGQSWQAPPPPHPSGSSSFPPPPPPNQEPPRPSPGQSWQAPPSHPYGQGGSSIFPNFNQEMSGPYSQRR